MADKRMSAADAIGHLRSGMTIGIGGWGNRDEKSGPYVRVKDGKVVEDTAKGRGGSHGAQHEFLVETLDADHPITRGLPAKWLHVRDDFLSQRACVQCPLRTPRCVDA